MPAETLERLEAALGEAAGTEVSLERPATPRTATTRPTSPCGLRACASSRRAKSRRSSSSSPRRSPTSIAPRSPDPASSTSGSPPAWYRDALAEILAAGDAYGSGSAHAEGARAGGDGLREPDRPAHRRVGAERRLRRHGRPAARVRGPRVEREYYYNDAGRADGPLPRVGGGATARGGAARGRLPRRLRRRARAGCRTIRSR